MLESVFCIKCGKEEYCEKEMADAIGRKHICDNCMKKYKKEQQQEEELQ